MDQPQPYVLKRPVKPHRLVKGYIVDAEDRIIVQHFHDDAFEKFLIEILNQEKPCLLF